MVINIDKAVVHPVMGEVTAVCRLTLGYLVFVVGEDKVKTAAMYVNSLA